MLLLIKRITHLVGSDEDVNWVLFESGYFSQPLAILTDQELSTLEFWIKQERENAAKVAKKATKK